jgi:hypothetical protein
MKSVKYIFWSINNIIGQVILKKVHNFHWDPFAFYHEMKLWHSENTWMKILKRVSFDILNFQLAPLPYLSRKRMAPWKCVYIIVDWISLPLKIGALLWSQDYWINLVTQKCTPKLIFVECTIWCIYEKATNE